MENYWNNIFIHDIQQTIFSVLFWIVVIILLNRLCNYFINHHSTKNKIIYLRIKRIVLYILLALILASQFKATNSIVTTLLASSGIIAVVVGIACQQTANSLIAGALILLNHPYKIGDFIVVESQNIRGNVIDINIHYTVIKTISNTTLTIPNTLMNTYIVENMTNLHGLKTNYINIGVSYDTDLTKAINIIQDTIYNYVPYQKIIKDKSFKNKKINDIVPVFIQEFESSSIPLKITIFSKDLGSGYQLCSDLRLELKKALDDNNITIPFNTITIDGKYNEK